MKHFKTSMSSKLVALMAGAALFGLVSQSAQALTQAGTSISNTATLNYTVAAVAQTPITSAAATFTVDDKVNVAVSGGIQQSVTPGQVGALTPFTVTNSGNATQGYNLVAANAASGGYTVAGAITDNFDPVVALTIYRDNNCNGLIDGADAVVTTIPTLNAGASACLLVSTTIPVGQINGDAAVVSMKATTVWPNPLVAAEEPVVGAGAGQMQGMGAVVTTVVGLNTAGVDVVFADAAGGATGLPADVASDGIGSFYGAYKVAGAVLSVSKVANVICDPINGNTNPKNIPGAFVQYAVTITNAAGASSASLSTVTDALNAALGFDTKLINGVGAGAVCTSAAGTSLSATGFSAVRGAGVATSYAAPGAALQNVTAGADFGVTTPGTVTINFATLAGTAYGVANAVLPASSYVTVYFNAIVQ